MNYIDELRHQANYHSLRYLINQGAGVGEPSCLKTDTVNQGSLWVRNPVKMLRSDLVKQAISSKSHPVNYGVSLINRKMVNFKFNRCEKYYHRFELLALSGRIRPFLCSDKLYRQWEEFVRPNGSIYHTASSVESFFKDLFITVAIQKSKQRELLRSLPHTYVNAGSIGWQEKYSEKVDELLNSRQILQKNKVTNKAVVSFAKDCPQPRVVTKECVEGLREIGIGKMLAALKLNPFVFSGIGVATQEGNSVLAMPYAHFEFVNLADIDSKDEIAQFQGIGLLHALLHAHDGVWANIARINDNLQAYDLAKSLIPARTVQGVDTRDPEASFVSLMNATPETRITLCSAILGTHLMDKRLPDSILIPFRDKKFLQIITEFPLRAFLDRQDPLKHDEKVLKLSEEQFHARAEKLYQLCQLERPLTLDEVFKELYPQEMLFVAAAKKLNMFCYHSIFPHRILKAAQSNPHLLTKKELRSLEKALHDLESASLPTDSYLRFVI